MNPEKMIEIRRALPVDAKALTDLGRKTFVETFAKDNRPEDMDMYVSATFSEGKQLAEIQDADRLIEIAWSGNQAAGFFHLLNGKTDFSVGGAKPLEILRLYVDSPWHGKGLGALLMNRCIELTNEKGFETLWLGVWEKNFRAQAFYKKYGFEVVGSHSFRLGNDDQTDLIMVRKV